MYQHYMKYFVAFILALSVSINLTYAARPGAYAGGGIGYGILSDFKDADNVGSSSPGAMLFVGYNFNPYFGIEGGYRTYPNTNYESSELYDVSMNYKMNAFTLVGKGYLPLADDSPIDLYMLFGFGQVHAKADIEAYQYNYYYNYYYHTTSSNTKIVPVVGLGLSYNTNRHITFNLEESVMGDCSGDDVNVGIPTSVLVTLNAAYNFS